MIIKQLKLQRVLAYCSTNELYLVDNEFIYSKISNIQGNILNLWFI